MQEEGFYDYIVIGAGPAGSMFCAKTDKKYRILRLDGSFRGQKPCGGLLAPQAGRALSACGFCLPKEVLADPQIFCVRTMDLKTGAERTYARNYLNLNRAAFDAWLKGLAGENVRTNSARLTAVWQENGGVGVEYILPGGEKRRAWGAAIVGADGASSLVRRSLFDRPLHTYTAIQQWFLLTGEPLYACIFHRPTSKSCSWLFSKDGRLAFGGAFAHEGARKNFEEQKRILCERCGFDLRKPLFTEACMVAAPRGAKDLCMGKPGVYLSGEAAGLISPTSFEGLSYALLSGALLAQAVNAGGDVFKTYEKSTAKLRREILLKRAKRPLMYFSALRNLILKSGVQAMRQK